MKKVLVLHGPNLNLLGTREPKIYGSIALEQINNQLYIQASQANINLVSLHSNVEGELIDIIHQAKNDNIHYLIVNFAALTHTSIALRDALIATALPFIEVHLSNIYARESFRHHSYFSDIAKGTITGFGASSYFLALDFIIQELQ